MDCRYQQRSAGNDIPCDSLLKVFENKAGDLAGTIVATDDETPTKVTFALVGQYDAKTMDVDIFEMDETTGEVKLKDNVSVNYEVNQYFGVDIIAMDPDGGATVKSFRVSVRDVNEKPIIIGNAGNPDDPKVYSADEDFADNDVKEICINHWDTNGDRELTKEEAAAVKELGDAFMQYDPLAGEEVAFNLYHPRYFDELQYFTRLTSIGESAFSYSDSLRHGGRDA